MKYEEPKKQGHNKGRNPDYPATTLLLHAPFKRAATRRQEELGDKSLATTLATAALKGDKALRELYKEERKDGDEQSQFQVGK